MSNARIDAALGELTRQNNELRNALVERASDIAEYGEVVRTLQAEVQRLKEELQKLGWKDPNEEAAPEG